MQFLEIRVIGTIIHTVHDAHGTMRVQGYNNACTLQLVKIHKNIFDENIIKINESVTRTNEKCTTVQNSIFLLVT